MRHEPYLLFRVDRDNEEEYEVAKSIWGDRIGRFRSDIPRNSLVVGRYSVLPFYRDLDEEIRHLGSRLINSYQDHKHIAEMGWYHQLFDPSHRTPKTWFNRGWANVPDTEHGWVVKGITNSRKFKWDTHMYAPTREKLKEVMHRCYDDPLLSDQGLAVREYVPLRKLEEGINGLPMTNEWRCFFLGETLVSAGFYWSASEVAEEMDVIPPAALETARWAADILYHTPFYVVDVAETQEGDWIIIEVNSGQMSGLSEIDPEQFYTRLKDLLHE